MSDQAPEQPALVGNDAPVTQSQQSSDLAAAAEQAASGAVVTATTDAQTAVAMGETATSPPATLPAANAVAEQEVVEASPLLPPTTDPTAPPPPTTTTTAATATAFAEYRAAFEANGWSQLPCRGKPSALRWENVTVAQRDFIAARSEQLVDILLYCDGIAHARSDADSASESVAAAEKAAARSLLDVACAFFATHVATQAPEVTRTAHHISSDFSDLRSKQLLQEKITCVEDS